MGGKKQVKKSVHSSSANNIGCPKAANNTPNPAINAVPVNKTVPGVKEDLEKTEFKKEVQKLKIQLAAEASGHAKVATNFQNLKVEVVSLKDNNLSLQQELISKKKLLLESQKELEQTKTFLKKEQQLRKQAEANGKSEMAALTSKEQKLQVQVQGLLKRQEELHAMLALETNRRVSVEQELKRAKEIAAEEKKRVNSHHMSNQSGKCERQVPTVVRQLADQQHQPSLALREQVDNRQQMDQYLREELEQMKNFGKLKQMETSAHMSIHGLVGPLPHTPTVVKQAEKSSQLKEPHSQDRLFGTKENATKMDAETSLSGADATSLTPQPNTPRSQQTTSAHARLVERLQERGNLLPIAPSECSLLVMKLRTSRGGLSGLTMDQIEGEVRRLAKEDARLRERECPICLDLMITDANVPGQLLRCVQCNQAFHSKCLQGWASRCDAKSGKAGCPICRAGATGK